MKCVSWSTATAVKNVSWSTATAVKMYIVVYSNCYKICILVYSNCCEMCILVYSKCCEKCILVHSNCCEKCILVYSNCFEICILVYSNCCKNMYPGSTATAVKKYTFFGQQLLSYLDLLWTGITVRGYTFSASTIVKASPRSPLEKHSHSQRGPPETEDPSAP